MRVALLLLALTAVCHGILPEIVPPGISHIQDDHARTEQNQETESISPEDERSRDLENSIGQPCTKDEECCDQQLCVWGQCGHNATRGEAGSTCWRQSDCSPDLCCALHAVLLFPVCSAKPIERERCFSGPNHVMELLSWDARDEGPRKHCPCAGELQCQHLGRGSMCLKEEDSSEEELADSFYSDIDYII
ncbi:unnamed protein product [Tetraodon nigroviridis]|uniref:(spotted green pufferfish) hypothetical protein n=1 Tax=Tetraodon nigroviridis TaxID=99883 RepID=Q4T7E9_TETNG|nr:unnamed protein product [Tetraodon nigroviridis]